MFLHSGLYENCLIKPVRETSSIDELLIVSGYASAGMGTQHIADLKEALGARAPKVRLIYGMATESGISSVQHEGFKHLCDSTGRFSCSYLVRGEAVHAKVYVWCANGQPVVAFAGSANYSHNAFREANTRREVLTRCPEQKAFDYFRSLVRDTAECTDDAAVREVVGRYRHREPSVSPLGIIQIETDRNSRWYRCQKITASLLKEGGRISERGRVHTRAGLNWGQRPGREPNQAYIPLKTSLEFSGFFPPLGECFTMLTDDGKVLECVTAQEHAKAIETYKSNRELGLYFRTRLGLQSGAYVNTEDLIRYGRTDVTIYKIDDENFALDFSPRR